MIYALYIEQKITIFALYTKHKYKNQINNLTMENELQVIGFQNTRYAVLSRPKLTCINNPIYELGEKAMDVLTDLMETPMDEDPIIKHELIDYNIIWRDSTKEKK